MGMLLTWVIELSTDMAYMHCIHVFLSEGTIIYVNHHTRGQFKGIKIGSNYKTPVFSIEDMSKVKHRGVDLNLEQVEVR